MMLCLVLALITPAAFAKDKEAEAAKDSAKAAAAKNKADKQVEKGHTIRAGRAAKKAEKAQEKADKAAAEAGK